MWQSVAIGGDDDDSVGSSAPCSWGGAGAGAGRWHAATMAQETKIIAARRITHSRHEPVPKVPRFEGSFFIRTADPERRIRHNTLSFPFPRMAVTATLHRFKIELADIDRNVYETLDLRVARHPSEDVERLVIRVLARAIEHEPDLEFGRGLSTVEDPALWTQKPTGEITTWIDVGIPSADRLHRASKRANRVVVFTHKPPAALRKAWSSRAVHKADAIEVVELDAKLVESLARQAERTVQWYLTLQDGVVTIAMDDESESGSVTRRTLADFLES